jgi:GAF domain-containing protein
MAFIEAVASEAAIALEGARLLEETQRNAERERILAEISSKVRASTDINTVLRTAVLELGRTLRAAEGVIQLEIKE